jgi:hypothetical protein
MTVSSSPRYAETWKAKRQTRLKPSGMTDLLAKYDKVWKGYDRDTFIQTVMGTGANGLRDIQRNIDGFTKATDEVESLQAKFKKDYNKAEIGLIDAFLKDVGEELTFWKAKKKDYVLTQAGTKEALEKLGRMREKFDALVADVVGDQTKLAKAHKLLTAADQFKDHSQPKGALLAFKKLVDAFDGVLQVPEKYDASLTVAAMKVADSYKSDKELATAVSKMQSAHTAKVKELKAARADRAVWAMWVEAQLKKP